MPCRLLCVTQLLTVLLLLIFTPAIGADEAEIHIGVLANKGKPAAITTWQPLIDYLGKTIPERKFILLPLDYNELYPAVKEGRLDFIITNTSQYIELEYYYGVSRIATFRNAGPGGFYTQFGGVLFVRAEREDISSIRDFPGHKVLATDDKAFGGWLMQLREIKAQGVDPGQFAEFKTTGNHEEVVMAILEGKSDIGAVRSDTLERMAEEGTIDLSQIKVINEQKTPGFPFLHSTRLYPEWPFVKTTRIDSTVSRKVAVALLTLPEDSPAAVAAYSGGWTIPENYNPAHELCRELKVAPYQDLGEFSAADVIEKYWPLILLSLLLLLIAGTAVLWVSMANRRLGMVLNDLYQTHSELEKANGLLMESIQYARVIQRSLLPDPQVLRGELAEVAILWEPLELVSGDYYWMGRADGKILIIVADCTGHGVPGAMVTMVLSASLDFIFHEGELTDPGRILCEIDQAIRSRLRQDMPGSVSDDGLEVAVSVYDPSTRILSFAGAGLPLLWVKDGSALLIKGDRAYLGCRTLRPKGTFEVHEILVEAGMLFYMFTDGVTNQMGGKPRQLFGRNRLANLIAGLSSLPLAEQISAIRDHLQAYRQDENVRDDMTMIAFRCE